MKIAATYIGSYEIVLNPAGGPYYDAQGQRLQSNILRPGETIQMEDTEVNGLTILRDPKGNLPSRLLGTGRVIRPQDSGLSPDDLDLIGYEFHEGRPDFVPYADSGASTPAPVSLEPQEQTGGVVNVSAPQDSITAVNADEESISQQVFTTSVPAPAN